MIYLASKSARRKEILKKLGVPFKVIPSSYQEAHLPGLAPGLLTVCHALGKARLSLIPKAARLVMGCDTVVACQKKVMGKPKNEKEAREMLGLLSGKRHTVYSGLVLWDRASGNFLKGYEKTEVFIKKLGDSEIRNYIRVIHPYDKAGGYAIQTRPKIVRKIQGSYTNVVGLPVELMIRLLKRL